MPRPLVRVLAVALVVFFALHVGLPAGIMEVRDQDHAYVFRAEGDVVLVANATLEREAARDLRAAYDLDDDGRIDASERVQAEEDLRLMAQRGGGWRAELGGAPPRSWDVVDVALFEFEGSVQDGRRVSQRIVALLTPDPQAAPLLEMRAHQVPQGTSWAVHAAPGFVVTSWSGLEQATLAAGGIELWGVASGSDVRVGFSEEPPVPLDTQESTAARMPSTGVPLLLVGAMVALLVLARSTR